MYEEDKQLATQCKALASEAGKAIEWLRRNSDRVQGREDHEKELRKAARIFENCAVAAERKMCVAVFGPSQAGKSYLSSALTGSETDTLQINLDEKTYSFLEDINPGGGKESTGLVTRFTLTPPVVTPKGYPVHIRLLSLIDVVKIFANTYFSDVDHMEAPNLEKAEELLSRLESKKQASPTGGLDEDNVEDLQEYIHKYFRGKARVQQILGAHFWQRVIPLAPRLDDTDRAALFGIIWDSFEPFTALALSLFRTLRSLDFAPEAFCPTSALTPREKSIIDVATLGDLAPDQNNQDNMLEVRTPSNTVVKLPREYVTALTAELVLPMDKKPADFFDHTDLLDFPGYRSRKMVKDLAYEIEKGEEGLKVFFLRGKVAYLFQRYCAERELTSLLLCIADSVQEVQGLGSTVSEWITSTHGATPALRKNKDTALFFILTKADRQLEVKGGDKEAADRWDTRIAASTELFSGTDGEWLRNWSEGKAFDNMFLMRNTTIQNAFFTYKGDEEIALNENGKESIALLEKVFFNSMRVQTHIANKEATWKAMVTPGDGGISIIREKLTPICKPELKRDQIRTVLEATLTPLINHLQPYYHTDDKDEEEKQKKILGQELARIILGMGKNLHFGRFIRLLTLRDQELYDLYFQARHQLRMQAVAQKTAHQPPAQTTADPSVEDLLKGLLGDELITKPDSIPENFSDNDSNTQTSSPKPPMDEAAAFAEAIEHFWLAKMREVAEDPVLQAEFAFPQKLFGECIHELGTTFVRLGLREQMQEILRQTSRYVDTSKERLVWKQVGPITTLINNYLDNLGFNPRTKSAIERTINMGGTDRVLFTPQNCVNGQPDITEEPIQYINGITTDWAIALMHIINENVHFDGVKQYDPVENSKLKNILTALAI